MYLKLLAKWINWVAHHAALVMGLTLTLTLIAAYVAFDRFKIDSDTSKLIRQDAPWKVVYDNFTRQLPLIEGTSFVVVSGTNLAAVNKLSKELESDIRAQSDLFGTVYAPNNLLFFEDNAFLYLTVDELDQLVSDLAEAQPFLTAMAEDPSLKGITELLNDGLNSGEEIPVGFIRIAQILTETLDSLMAGSAKQVDWRSQLIRDPGDTYYNIIIVKGKMSFEAGLPNAEVVGALREIIHRSNRPADIKVRLTGQIPLDHDEILSAMTSAQLAGSVALVLLILVLVLGVRSIRVITATYLSMIIGLIWTAAYATFAVGQYNTISIVFLVMFIGLGVDFAIHLCLRYQEKLAEQDKLIALCSAATEVAPAITLCAITSALGFLAFVPTDYRGLAELGIISAGGMLIALVVTFTVIPSFFSLTASPNLLSRGERFSRLSHLFVQQKAALLVFTLFLAMASGWFAQDIYFDYSTLALKDPDSEAMTTLRELQEEKIVTDYAISLLVETDEAHELVARLEALPTVAEVISLEDFLPEHQLEKLNILEDASILLASTFYATRSITRLDEGERRATVALLHGNLRAYLERNPAGDENLISSLTALSRALDLALRRQDFSSLALHYETLLVAGVTDEIGLLEHAIAAEVITTKDLPRSMLERLVTRQGRQLMSVIPTEDIAPVKALEQFVTEVRAVHPEATGKPVLDLEVGEIVISAFTEAIIYALISICLVLYLSLRSVVDTLAVFIPIGVATLMTLATSVLIGLPLNMANVVVVPLIFGLGVDNGIHVVKRFREGASFSQLSQTSTPRAVFLSTLTTLGTFSALSLSSHQGIYSIGVLLTCALTFQLALTLIALPAFLAQVSGTRRST